MNKSGELITDFCNRRKHTQKEIRIEKKPSEENEAEGGGVVGRGQSETFLYYK